MINTSTSPTTTPLQPEAEVNSLPPKPDEILSPNSVDSSLTSKLTSPLSPLESTRSEPNNYRLKISRQNLLPTSYSSANQTPTDLLSPTYPTKITRASSISDLPQYNIDFLANGFSSSLGTSPSHRIQRNKPNNSNLGGFGQKESNGTDYPSSLDLSRSPLNDRGPESPFNRSHFSSFLDSKPPSRAYNTSEMLATSLNRSRATSNAEFAHRLRLSSLKDESPFLDRRLSSSMSPMFGRPEHSPLFRGYVNGSPHLGSSFGQDFDQEIPFALNPNDYYRSGFARRMSLTPNFGAYNPYDELTSQMETLTLEEYNHLLTRRHSVAASAFPTRKPSAMEVPDSNRLDPLDESKDDQFEQFTLDMGTTEVSKPFTEISHLQKFYVVEFKANRNDLFYPTHGCNAQIRVGSYVVVEGDRGKDLGIVIRDPITIEDYKQNYNQITHGPDGTQTLKEVEPKKIFRLAMPHEIASLELKKQDELKALNLVKEKSIQRELYMKLVDAEYQWDRRKLTIYFIADRRIDFRDLVRELFKIYKTRIWMCAVNV